MHSIVLTAASDIWTTIRKLVQARWARSQSVLCTWLRSTERPQAQALQHWVREMVPRVIPSLSAKMSDKKFYDDSLLTMEALA